MHLRPFQLSGPGPTVFRVRRGKPRCHIRKLILDLLISPKSLTMRMIIKPPFRISWVCDWNLRESWKWLRSYLTKVWYLKYFTLFTQGVTDDVTVIGHSWDTGKFLLGQKRNHCICWNYKFVGNLLFASGFSLLVGVVKKIHEAEYYPRRCVSPRHKIMAL